MQVEGRRLKEESLSHVAENYFDEKVLDRNRTVLVTGGTGYLGKNLVQALLKRGFILNLLVRENSNLSGLEGCNFFLGDVNEPDSVRPAVENCAFIFHLAAKVGNWSSNPAEFDRVNVQGYENLLRLAAESGVKKVLHTSSFMIFGPSDGSVHTEESRCSLRPFGDYDRTMILAENVTTAFREKGLAIISLFPGIVYGPGEKTDRNLASMLAGAYSRGWMRGLLGEGRQKWNFVHMDDVITGHLAAMRRGGAGRYVLGGENASVADFLSLASGLLNRKTPSLKVPLKLAKALTLSEELRARWAHREPRMTRPLSEMLASHWACSSDKAERELGYRPRPLETGLRESVEWLREQ